MKYSNQFNSFVKAITLSCSMFAALVLFAAVLYLPVKAVGTNYTLEFLDAEDDNTFLLYPGQTAEDLDIDTEDGEFDTLIADKNYKIKSCEAEPGGVITTKIVDGKGEDGERCITINITAEIHPDHDSTVLTVTDTNGKTATTTVNVQYPTMKLVNDTITFSNPNDAVEPHYFSFKPEETIPFYDIYLEDTPPVLLEVADAVVEDPNVATAIYEDGAFTEFYPHNPGTSKVTLKDQYGREIQGTIIVKEEYFRASINGVEMKNALPSKKIAPGVESFVQYKIDPEYAVQFIDYSFASSDPSVATIDNNGYIKFIKAGKATFTLTATDTYGVVKTASLTYEVMKGGVKSIKIKGKSKVKAGKKLRLKPIIKTTAAKGVNKKLKWSVSNKKYASINSKGVLKTKKAGKGKKITVYAKSTDGTNKQAKKKIKITK